MNSWNEYEEVLTISSILCLTPKYDFKKNLFVKSSTRRVWGAIFVLVYNIIWIICSRNKLLATYTTMPVVESVLDALNQIILCLWSNVTVYTSFTQIEKWQELIKIMNYYDSKISKENSRGSSGSKLLSFLTVKLLSILFLHLFLRSISTLIWTDFKINLFLSASVWYIDDHIFAAFHSISIFIFYQLVQDIYWRYNTLNNYLMVTCNAIAQDDCGKCLENTTKTIRYIGKLYRLLNDGVENIDSIFGTKVVFFNSYVLVNILMCFSFIYHCAVYKLYNVNIIIIYAILAVLYTVSIIFFNIFTRFL